MAVRVCFFGTPEPAVPALEALVADPAVEVAAAVTNPDRPRGRGKQLAPPPVKRAAATHEVPVWQPERPAEIVDELWAMELDACAVVAYGAVLPGSVLEVARTGFINLHFSLLPSWRGAAPVSHTLLNGDRETGLSCFVLTEGLDEGPLLTRLITRVQQKESAGQLTARLAEAGAPLLVEALTGLVDGAMPPRPQRHAEASYAPKLGPDEARIDWSQPAEVLERRVRAMSPVPGAYTMLDSRRLKVHAASVVADGTDPARHGEVVAVEPDGVVVACGQGLLRLERVQPAGKAAMDGADFAHGNRPLGRRLGEEVG
jgi:methionyl-tRNA formyltransferase